MIMVRILSLPYRERTVARQPLRRPLLSATLKDEIAQPLCRSVGGFENCSRMS
jgi:hypothetical protein